MKLSRSFSGFCCGFSLLLCSGLCAAQQSPPGGQDPPNPPAEEKAPARTQATRMTIEVTGGDDNKPVENASVYLKTLEQGKLKDKKFEVNVKTNMAGVAHVPDAPTGRVLIQVVVTGWKTYGHWYDVTNPGETIKIHLERPPKWY